MENESDPHSFDWLSVKEDSAGYRMADEIEERLIDLSVRTIKVANALPKTSAGNHVAGQILRSGTSPASNYAEARGAESLSDFIHKLGVVRKELNETHVWLRVITKAELLPEARLAQLREECIELKKIIASSLATLRRKKNEK
jgi:four helix bundle protein